MTTEGEQVTDYNDPEDSDYVRELRADNERLRAELEAARGRHHAAADQAGEAEARLAETTALLPHERAVLDACAAIDIHALGAVGFRDLHRAELARRGLK